MASYKLYKGVEIRAIEWRQENRENQRRIEYQQRCGRGMELAITGLKVAGVVGGGLATLGVCNVM